MFEFEKREPTSVFSTIAASVISMMIFVAVWIPAEFLLHQLARIRGQSGDWLQLVFNGLLAPGLGGYAGLFLSLKWISKAHPGALFALFAGIMLLAGGFLLGAESEQPVLTQGRPLSLLFVLAIFVSSTIGAYHGAMQANS